MINLQAIDEGVINIGSDFNFTIITFLGFSRNLSFLLLHLTYIPSLTDS